MQAFGIFIFLVEGDCDLMVTTRSHGQERVPQVVVGYLEEGVNGRGFVV